MTTALIATLLCFVSIYHILQIKATSTSNRPEWHDEYTSDDAMTQMQHVSIAGSSHGEAGSTPYDDYPRQYTWLSPEHAISEGPSLATVYLQQEEEDTANSSLQPDSNPYSDREEGIHDQTLQDEIDVDPTTLALRKQSTRRIINSNVAWHAPYALEYKDIIRAFINILMAKRGVNSEKTFKKITKTLSQDTVQKVQHVFDTLIGWERHQALLNIADEHLEEESMFAKDTWKKGLSLEEIAELKRLIKVSGRVKGGVFLRSMDLQGRKNALIPGTKENKRITKVFVRKADDVSHAIVESGAI